MAESATPATLVDWLDDLSVRFLLNLPKSELSSVPRLCFQVEEAQWFYEDFVRPAVAASGAQPLPSLPLRQFCLMLFQHCPLLSGYNDAQHLAAYEEFLAYKVRVPVRGAIMLDESMEKVVLVRGWKKGSSWSFPRGKINKDEKDLDCAIREVYEETGYDVRQAGLVPEDEKEAKYIDITMREQHMRLFVFRGVPEETHFEPRTRKEISKIDWYYIKDLPGFKKQKHGQGGDAGNANKFYMVAPFLGQLKKWINLQRKKDASQPRHTRVTSDGLGVQTATEDEGETEEATPEPAPLPDQRSEELKRLLSIGGGNAAPAQPTPAQPDNQKNDLLAMLRGSSQPVNGNLPPQTPYEQVNAITREPETPHPDHMRQPSIPPQQQPPPYPLSPPRMQQEQQRNYSMPTPHIFGPGPQFGGPPPNHQQGFSGMFPPHMQQQHLQQRQSVPNMPFGPPNNGPFTGPPGQQQMPPAWMQQQQQPQAPYQQLAPNAYMAQGPQGAIASGPSVPNPSQLPAPRLNAHHMNLLNAFKSGNDHGTAPTASVQPNSKHGSTHQAALLDLFRKPSTPQPQTSSAEFVPEKPEEQPVSPTLTDVTERPRPPKKERKPTLNEITRTLPLKPKAKSPAPDTTTAPPSRPPASGQLFDPTAEKPIATSQTRQPPQQQGPTSVLQRPTSSQSAHLPRPKASASPAQDAPVKQQKANGAIPAPFKILARPDSRGLKSPGPGPAVPPSPLRNQTPQSSSSFQPQVLKRPKSGDGEPSSARAHETRAKQQASVGDGQRDHLLALFGKGAGSPAPAASPATMQSPPPVPAAQAPSSAPSAENGKRNALLDLLKSPPSSQQPTPAPAAAPAVSPPPSPAPAPTAETGQRNALLTLLKSPSPTPTPPTAPTPSLQPPQPPPNPPSAPRLSPSRNPSTQNITQNQKIHPVRQPVQPPTGHHHNLSGSHFSTHNQSHTHSHSRGNGQQNLLLDIFTRPSSSASSQRHQRTNTPPINSPGTPISPFTLGTPVHGQSQGQGLSAGFGGRQERLGSLASTSAASSAGGAPERKGSGGTPVEAKDREFLMGFLKGVAKGDA